MSDETSLGFNLFARWRKPKVRGPKPDSVTARLSPGEAYFPNATRAEVLRAYKALNLDPGIIHCKDDEE